MTWVKLAGPMNSVFHDFYKKLLSSFKFIYSLNTKVHEDNTIHVQCYNVHINEVKGTEVHMYIPGPVVIFTGD